VGRRAGRMGVRRDREQVLSAGGKRAAEGERAPRSRPAVCIYSLYHLPKGFLLMMRPDAI